MNPSRIWLVAGLLSIFLAAVFSWLALSIGPRWLSFGAAFFVLTGFSFLVPRVLFRFSKLAAHLLRALAELLRALAVHALAAAQEGAGADFGVHGPPGVSGRKDVVNNEGEAYFPSLASVP